MTHPSELLSAFLDGETSVDEAEVVRSHLESCGACRNEIDDLASARAAVRSLPILDVPSDLLGPAPVVVPIRPRRRPLVMASVAAVAVIAIALTPLMAVDRVLVDVDEVATILAAASAGVPDAADSEVGQVLARAASASWSARRTTSCAGEEAWDDTVDVVRARGTTVASDPLGGTTVLADSTVTSGPIEGPLDVVTVEHARPQLDRDYLIGSTEPGTVRGRSVSVITVVADGVPRFRWSVDDETGAFLVSQTLDANGAVTCQTELVEFRPQPQISASVPFAEEVDSSETIHHSADTDLPAALGGLALVDAWAVGESVVGWFSDGLLSAAVVSVDGEVEASGDAPVALVEGTGYAVVGALPGDVLAAVVDDLSGE